MDQNVVIINWVYFILSKKKDVKLTCLIRLGPQVEDDHLDREYASAYRLSLINPLHTSQIAFLANFVQTEMEIKYLVQKYSTEMEEKHLKFERLEH